ncbi:hypothetical protein ACQ5SO_10215 [Rhodovulum sp. DZ06]|uniref:hypothetical protein n=1 Tax=Rhodovulum sp. DZ06 TaxID=3425126 RepID=UPI003D33D930
MGASAGAGAGLSARDLLAGWSPGGRGGAHARIGALLARAAPDAAARAALGGESLGARNQRLVRLHRALFARPLEARLDCACGQEVEATLPEAAILAAPTPGPGAEVAIDIAGRALRFRIPRMADLALGADPARLAAACCLAPPAPPLSPDAAAALGAAFEAADPAGDIRLSGACPECGAPLSAAADPAALLAAELDRLHAALLGQVDCIARAYGWSEAQILALPAARRRSYIALIQAREAVGRGSRAWA